MNQPFSAHFDHVELFVPSRFEAADWYRRMLGLHVVEGLLEWASDTEGPLMIGPQGGGPMLGLFTRSVGKPGPARPAGTLRGIAFRTDGAGFLAFLEFVTTNPVHDGDGGLTTEPRIEDYGQAISAYFFDPYGTPLEVTTYETPLVRARLGTRPEEVGL